MVEAFEYQFIHQFAYFTKYNSYYKPLLRKKCPYLELFWSVFYRIRTKYLSISPYSVRMRENTDQNNSKHRLFLRSAVYRRIVLHSDQSKGCPL